MNEIPTMMTIQKASAVAGISYRAIRQMIAEDKIAYIKIGQKFLINLESLVKYLNEGDANG